MKANIGMIGLAVMGENLVLNIESKGFSVAAFDIDSQRMNQFKANRAQGKNIVFAESLADLVAKLETPRKVMMMIRAGNPVDQVISSLIPLLAPGDIIIDGGNSHFPDTERRMKLLEEHQLYFIGAGVSGGEEGALKGPSIMPGGSAKAWEEVRPILQSIAAKTSDGEVCCEWVGDGGAGHFVKMVHNGIEYGDIQLITEIYAMMKNVLGMSSDEMAEVFAEWNQTELDSYLIEITSHILKKKDTDNTPLVEKILDTAGQKGTGKWTVIASLEEGVPLPLIDESVHARALSALKEDRLLASKAYLKPTFKEYPQKQELLSALKDALYAAKIISYAQGFVLMRQAALSQGWKLNFGEIALMWRGGCIIRSAFLGKIKDAYDQNPQLKNLLLDPYFQEAVSSRIQSWRNVVSTAVLRGIAIPTLASGLSYFDGLTTEQLPANLLQAMRDYFGAHTYERIDQPRGKFFHTNWTGEGGDTSSTTYNV